MGTEARARLALAVLLAFTLWTFAEVFRGGEYPGPTLLGMLMAGGIAVITRRLGWSALLSFVVSGVALVWYLCLVFASSATSYGIPTGTTFNRLGHWITIAAQKSNTDVAPAPPRPGYALLVVAGMWVAAAIGETAAFRWQRPVLAALPCIVMFSLVLVVGTGTAAPVVVALFVIVLLSFWGLESSNRLRSWGRWVPTWPGHPEEPPPQITGSLARRMAVWCVAGVFVTPLLLPLGSGLINWRSGSGHGHGKGVGGVATVDPLVSIAPTLVNQTNQELMRVKARTATYWRLETLAVFNGTSWSAASTPNQPLSGSPAAQIHLDLPPRSGGESVTQTFSLTHLQTRFLPAAVNPTTISVNGPSTSDTVLADPKTGDLQLRDTSAPGFTYQVRSVLPQVGYDALQQDDVGNPGQIYLQRPEHLSQAVINLARRWTAGAQTPLEKALDIQRHLRRFHYSLNVKPRASTDYLTDFLTKTKAGFCQQFATAFTLLARLSGLPTRIAVGFLPGSENNEQTFIVRGSDAHAWPEIYFKHYGWLRFEPTPRLAAAVPPYSVVPVKERVAGGAPGSSKGPSAATANRLGQVDRADVAAKTGVGGAPFIPRSQHHRTGPPQWERAWARFGRKLLIAAVLVLLAIPVLKSVRTALRYSRARGARAVTEAAFAHFEDEAAQLADARARSESAIAYVERLTSSRKLSPKAALRLARIYEQAEYSPAGVDQPEAEEARRLVRQLRIDLWSAASWWDRAERIFSPAALTRRS